MSHSKSQSIGIFASLLLTAVQVAAANDSKPVVVANQVRVQYGDLNLQSPLAADLLIARIARAANQACGSRPALGPGYYVSRRRYAACIEHAEHDAVATMNQPLVTAAYERKLSPSAARFATR
jgi:UrcA family protein